MPSFTSSDSEMAEPAGPPRQRPSLESLLRAQHITSLSKELDLSYARDLSQGALAVLCTTLPQLNRLVLRDVGLTALPQELSHLALLRELDVSCNQIGALPEQLCELSRLQHVNLSHNRLAKLPQQLDRLARLRLLNANYNALTALPEKLGYATQLRVLRLGANQLTALPESLGLLRELRLLQLAYNQFEQVPNSCTSLPRLKVLDLGHNHLTELPPSLRQKKTLLSLNVVGNPLSEHARRALFGAGLKVTGLAEGGDPIAAASVDLYRSTPAPPDALVSAARPDLTGIFLAGLDAPQTATGSFLLEELDNEHTHPEAFVPEDEGAHEPYPIPPAVQPSSRRAK